jgi:type IV pilus assembly protein PilA
MRQECGFTLLEMVIAVALILILAAITIPSLVESKINANEASAVGCIRSINTAEVSYQAVYGGYADGLVNLGGAEPCTKSAATACLLDDSLTGGDKSGYKFAAIGGNPSGGMNTTYVAGAAPDVFDHTGKRLFCSTEKDVIRVDSNAAGSVTPPDGQQCGTFKALR